MNKARLIRRYTFRASHHYGQTAWSEAKNQEVFGDQTVPHEHVFRLTVEVVGPIRPDTGYVVDLGALDGAVASVTAGWDGGDLNRCVDAVARGDIQPSTEALAAWLHASLAPRIPLPARLERVRLFESADMGSIYPG